MTSTLIKLRKGKKDFDWNEKVPTSCLRLEIISPSLEELPDKFHEVPLLESLEIHCPELKELPASFYELQNLKLLKLKNAIQINLEGPAQFTQLRTLQLAKLKIEKVPMWLEFSNNLEVLDLHGNCLNDLPDYFKSFSSLKRLNLDSNQFTTLPWELENLASLSHLSLDNNSFNEDEKLRIHKVFKISF